MGEEFDDMTETTVEEQGPLDQIGSSIKGMLVGLACFVIAWPVLFWGASRVEWSKVFKNAVPVAQAKEGKPTYLTGVTKADQIGDKHLTKGNYLRIMKSPEVFAYVEHEKSESKTTGRVKKKKTTKTTYSYTTEWTSYPKATSSFNQKFWTRYAQKRGVNPNVQNPTLEEKSETINAPNGKVNNYNVDTASISFYGGSKDKGAIYVKGVKGKPRVGDKRIKYSVYPSNVSYTFIGTLSDKNVQPYYEGTTDSKLAAGPGNFQALLAAIKAEDKLKGMLYFFGGFILMALGLNMLVGPITTLLEFVPVLGDLGAGLIRIVLTVFALIVSAVFYWLIKLWFVWVILLAGIVGFLIYKKKFAAKAASASPA